MVREKLRRWLMGLAFGKDPRPVLETLHRAVSHVQAMRVEQAELRERLERLERVALVALDPLDAEELRKRLDPSLGAQGVVLCTATDAHVTRLCPLERFTVG
jgi:hypothetical protein